MDMMCTHPPFGGSFRGISIPIRHQKSQSNFLGMCECLLLESAKTILNENREKKIVAVQFNWRKKTIHEIRISLAFPTSSPSNQDSDLAGSSLLHLWRLSKILDPARDWHSTSKRLDKTRVDLWFSGWNPSIRYVEWGCLILTGDAITTWWGDMILFGIIRYHYR